VPRANIAATPEHPYGTTAGNYAELNKDRPVLAQHVAFFDKDGDNILWPLDTWRGFREMGYNFFWCTFAMCVIHFFFSWFTAPGFLPDPFFRVFIKNGHRSKHGSDTAVYDSEGRFIPAKFEEIFTKYAARSAPAAFMIHAQRQAVDPIGWCAEAFEWASTYILIWPQDGLCDKESIRTVYDVSHSGRLSHTRQQLELTPWRN
ncbi:Caleosin-domain-containing protein, partial [Rhodotorula sp. JG-1b]